MHPFLHALIKWLCRAYVQVHRDEGITVLINLEPQTPLLAIEAQIVMLVAGDGRQMRYESLCCITLTRAGIVYAAYKR